MPDHKEKPVDRYTDEQRAKARARMRKVRARRTESDLEREKVKRREYKRALRRKNGSLTEGEISRRAVIRRATRETTQTYRRAIASAMRPPWSRAGRSDREAYRIRYSTDLDFNIKERLRRQQTKARQRNGVAELIRGSIARNGKSPTIERLFGYTIEQLREHLERQFTVKMGWDEFLAGRIHIDHVRPQSSFNLDDDAEYRECWSLPNLRPVWAAENLRKGAKSEFLL